MSSCWSCGAGEYDGLQNTEEPEDHTPVHDVLPLELFEYILSFLPVCELFSCSQVAKEWFNTISKPHFLAPLQTTIEKSHQILLLGGPTIRWLWSEQTFQQREKMSKDLDIFYFSNESKVSDLLRKICFDKIKYSNSICGWQREYFVRVFYKRIHYHLNVRLVAYPKEFHADVPPSRCLFLFGSNNPSKRFLRRSHRHIKRECEFIPDDQLIFMNLNLLVSSRRSELSIEEEGESVFHEAYTGMHYPSRRPSMQSTGSWTSDRYSRRPSMQSTGSYNENSLEEIPPEADLQQVVVDDDHLDVMSDIDFVWNRREGITGTCLHHLSQYIIDTMCEKAKQISPDIYEEEANRIIQRQDKCTDLRMTFEAVLVGSLGNFIYPLVLLPFCLFFDILYDPFQSALPYPVALFVGLLRFLESIIALILFTVFGVWGSTVGTTVYNYGLPLAMKHLLPEQKPPQCRIFTDSGWFE